MMYVFCVVMSDCSKHFPSVTNHISEYVATGSVLKGGWKSWNALNSLFSGGTEQWKQILAAN